MTVVMTIVLLVMLVMKIHVVILEREIVIMQIQMIPPKICLSMNISVRVCSLVGKMTAIWN